MGKEEKLSALAAGRDLYDSIRSILLDSRMSKRGRSAALTGREC